MRLCRLWCRRWGWRRVPLPSSPADAAGERGGCDANTNSWLEAHVRFHPRPPGLLREIATAQRRGRRMLRACRALVRRSLERPDPRHRVDLLLRQLLEELRGHHPGSRSGQHVLHARQRQRAVCYCIELARTVDGVRLLSSGGANQYRGLVQSSSDGQKFRRGGSQ